MQTEVRTDDCFLVELRVCLSEPHLMYINENFYFSSEEEAPCRDGWGEFEKIETEYGHSLSAFQKIYNFEIILVV